MIDRDVCFALAWSRCMSCGGAGQYLGRGRVSVCKCVWRGVFRACLARYQECRYRNALGMTEITRVVTERGVGASYQRQSENYLVDFELVVKRSLSPFGRGVFDWHFLRGREGPECCRRLGCAHADFWHEVYRVQAAGGRALVEAKPFPLFPVWHYFRCSLHEPEPGLFETIEKLEVRAPATPITSVQRGKPRMRGGLEAKTAA